MKQTNATSPVAPIEAIIEEARQGRMFILVDHEDRENEGDLVIPAAMCDARAVNFMATHGRGLICLALTSERTDQLNLPLMASTNSSRHETAFTVSIEAREGVTTGISAADRACTVATAIDPGSGAQSLASPGHVFPLRAQDGGVLVRAGHTEAAVDISRLAGLNPSGVICEIMNEDGTMARLPDLIGFAARHGLKIGTISDLIAYRQRHDNLVQETSRRLVSSPYGGEWLLRIFTDRISASEHIVLSKGTLEGSDPALVRMHMLNPLEDLFGIGGSPGKLAGAMAEIAREGRGAVLFFRDRMPLPSGESLAAPQILRRYGIGAQILASLGLRQLRLLSNSPLPRIVGIEGYGLTVVGTCPIPV